MTLSEYSRGSGLPDGKTVQGRLGHAQGLNRDTGGWHRVVAVETVQADETEALEVSQEALPAARTERRQTAGFGAGQGRAPSHSTYLCFTSCKTSFLEPRDTGLCPRPPFSWLTSVTVWPSPPRPAIFLSILHAPANQQPSGCPHSPPPFGPCHFSHVPHSGPRDLVRPRPAPPRRCIPL